MFKTSTGWWFWADVLLFTLRTYHHPWKEIPISQTVKWNCWGFWTLLMWARLKRLLLNFNWTNNLICRFLDSHIWESWIILDSLGILGIMDNQFLNKLFLDSHGWKNQPRDNWAWSESWIPRIPKNHIFRVKISLPDAGVHPIFKHSHLGPRNVGSRHAPNHQSHKC